MNSTLEWNKIRGFKGFYSFVHQNTKKCICTDINIYLIYKYTAMNFFYKKLYPTFFHIPTPYWNWHQSLIYIAL